MKFLSIILLFGFLAVFSEAKSYNGYKTFRVWPKNKGQSHLLKLLEGQKGIDFWSPINLIGKPVDIMIAPSKINFFKTFMYANYFNASILNNNVAHTLEEPIQIEYRSIGNTGISFTKYETLSTINQYLHQLTETYPEITSVFNIGKTFENRDILGLKISPQATRTNNTAIFIDCGIHAREWLAPATCLYIINQLVENPDNEDMISDIDWYIIPVLNPDGYEFTQTSDRMWRKNRSDGRRCRGTDLNRNYDFHWNTVGASDNECSETFAGKTGFSEKESSQFRDFVYSINKNKNIQLYLTFHSYGEYILYPWGYTESYPPNHEELDRLAHRVNDAVKAVRGTDYTIGSSTNVLYAAAGGSDDWMMSVGVPLSYTIELPGGGWGFDPPASNILPVVQEMFEGIKVYTEYVRTGLYN